jgi:hypothetical protein
MEVFVRPKPADHQNLLFSAQLEQILDHNHPLFKLANAIDWSEFEQAFGKLYAVEMAMKKEHITASKAKEIIDLLADSYNK